MAPFVQRTRPAAVLLSAVILAASAACDGSASLKASAEQPSTGGAKQDDKKKEPERIPVKIAGKTFKLEPALDDATRIKGLGDRKEIEDSGGMVFIFTSNAPRDFVMRDCPAAIDILYLDGAGRILTMHEMLPEAPRKADESAEEYENRLKRYPSRFPTGVVVELKGGKIKELGLKAGDQLDFDIAALKKRAR